MHDDLETFFGLVLMATQQGDTLVSATLKDQKGYLLLPVTELRDAPFSNPIRQLRQQWEAILAQPSRAYLTKRELTQRLHKSQDDTLASIRSTLCITQDLLEQSQQCLREGPHKTRLLNRYQHILTVYNQMLVRHTASVYCKHVD